jgi:hypothetical protein
MPTLPSDFWTTPQPGGLTGLIIGCVIGGGLSFYYFPGGGPYSWQGFVTNVMALVGSVLGAVIGELVGLLFRN